MPTEEKPMTSATFNFGGRLRTAMAFTVLAACVAIGAAGGVQAATADTPTRTVRYSDLNLSTRQGALALYGRIVAAAHQVCEAGNMLNPDSMAAARVCRDEAIAKAIRDVDSPMLASVSGSARSAI